jgi:hypothetical protein
MKNQIIARLKMPYLPSRLCAFFALLCAVLLPAPARATKGATDPQVIKDLAAGAFVWGYGPQFIYRFSQYNTIIGAPFNAFKYSTVPAAWNNEASNAGDASVLYISAFVDLATNDLVLTVPPSRTNYYVVAYYEGYANTMGSIGTRTTPSDTLTSYLLVGPNSPYANKPTARIHGYEYPVMASDTDLNWFLIRVLANTLIDASDPNSLPNVTSNVAQKFALNTLQQFETNGHRPVYPASFFTPPANSNQVSQAAQWQNTPTNAVDFFNQLGTAVTINPIPNRGTGLSGMLVANLPTYVTPQYGASNNPSATYFVPSYGQKETLALFAPLGLTEKGFNVPNNWGSTQLQALQDGYELGQQILNAFITNSAPGSNANYWGIINDVVGTFPNDATGYLYRSLIVVEGGVANIPLDAIYPTTLGNPTHYDGNHTYKLTFTPPTSYNQPLTSPAVGIYPPIVTNSSGNPKGFWSIHVYATDPTEAAAPFIAQTSVLNTHYSTADTAVLAVDTVSNTMTVSAPNWGGPLVASNPILFGGDPAAYGLTPGTVYYVANTPATNADSTEYTFKISTNWVQELSPGGVPIQNSGSTGPIVDLLAPAAPAPLTYGPVKPVTQLGSDQLAANQMATNSDGSLTLWFGPELPPGAPASNWIPTPNTNYYSTIYTTNVTTSFQLTLRMYYPRPGNEPPSILPCTEGCSFAGSSWTNSSYIPPLVEEVQ